MNSRGGARWAFLFAAIFGLCGGSLVPAFLDDAGARGLATEAVAEAGAGSTLPKARFRRPELVPFPASNPHSVEKERLGKALFFDPRLSRSASASCASCHNPSFGWTDALPRAVGHGMRSLPRRTPPVMNLAWGVAFQWDGRAETLEEQARMPITAPDEMNMTMEEVVDRLRSSAGYRERFAAAFGGRDPVTPGNVAAALATYQRTLVSGQAPFDRWIEGDESAIASNAKKGFALFVGKARCAACHSGWRFTDDSFHDIGLRTEDLGRGRHVPPQIVGMRHAFKTPSLRDLRPQGPFMHDGSLRTLGEVVQHYVDGGERRPSLSAEMKPIDLTADEKRDLETFLLTLRGEQLRVELPHLP